MKKINVEELTGKFNEFRMNSLSKTFTRQELVDKLLSLGFNKGIVAEMIPKLFPFEKMGTSRLYGISKEPIHKSQIASLYRGAYDRKKKSSKATAIKKEKPSIDVFADAKEVNDAIHLLLSKGYKISRPLGLDVKQLLADHPELTQKYMRYDVIK